MRARTLFGWLRRQAKGTLSQLKPRGRPADQAPVAERNRVIAFLREQGPHVGLPTLQAEFSELARRELEDLQRRYRWAHLRRNRLQAEVLTWHEAGTVWAMDFTQIESLPIDGVFTHLLVVRDLASGEVLDSLPATGEDATTCVGVLAALFKRFGAPLVLKADNGSAFIADAARALAKAWGVELLYSPPYTPGFNGSAEAGMGSLKTRAHYSAVRHGRPGAWSCDDVERARREINELVRPWGPNGPTRAEVWTKRKPISAERRARFQATVASYENWGRELLGHEPEAVLSRVEQAKVGRKTIRRALVERGFLCVERRWVSQRLRRRNRAVVS
jgi:transposase InsO family protein